MIAASGDTVFVIEHIQDTTRFYLRRSFDGGVNWSSRYPIIARPPLYYPGLFYVNSILHLAFNCADTLFYMYSTDLGETWSSPFHLTEPPEADAIKCRNIVANDYNCIFVPWRDNKYSGGTMDDISWMGPQPSMKERTEKVGISNVLPFGKLKETIKEALEKNRKIHYLPPYRGKQTIQLAELLGKKPGDIKEMASVELIKSVVKLRSVKNEEEVKEIEFALNIAYNMHTTAMKMAMPGIVEREIAGKIEGIALREGLGVSFPIILTINGQTLHNHYHGNTLYKIHLQQN